MESAGSDLEVPLPVEVKVGPSWGSLTRYKSTDTLPLETASIMESKQTHPQSTAIEVSNGDEVEAVGGEVEAEQGVAAGPSTAYTNYDDEDLFG